MAANISKLIESLPDKAPRSKLEIYHKDIAALRKKGYSYKAIADFLKEHVSLQVAPSTLCWFLLKQINRNKTVEPMQANTEESIQRGAEQLAPPSLPAVEPKNSKHPVQKEKTSHDFDRMNQPTLPFSDE